jgi:hypothetical protein
VTAEVDTYQGRLRRRCEECGVEVEIERPTRVIAQSSERSWRRAFRKEVQNQVLFEALCDDCREWWNELLQKIEFGGQPRSRRRRNPDGREPMEPQPGPPGSEGRVVSG